MIRMQSVFFLVLVLTVSLLAADTQKMWFFFSDKGQALNKASMQQARNLLSDRALERRAKVTAGALVDATDLPVHTDYIDQLKNIGVYPHVISRWLNGISAEVTPEQIAAARQLSFVRAIQPVLKYKKPRLPQSLEKPGQTQNFDYGPSLTQNSLIQVPDVHSLGLNGAGVLVGVFDSGFNLNHTALDGINIIDSYDFVNDDPNVTNEPGQDQSGQHNHGTSVLSLVGSYMPGDLIGPAYGADYILAKTETIASETQAEEDNWIAAAEWAEGLGVDIITTSLGYLDWYETEDLDGDTAPITRAADLAAKKGVLVVVSAGNEGNDSWRYVTPPADGDSVVAVGAVTSSGFIAGFSSLGPTYDGRIKPEVVAMGVNCTIASSGDSGFRGGNGTSYACPQVAGVAALILQAHPDLGPMQVRQALMLTADQSRNPDNTYGFGLVNALDAVNYHGSVIDLPDTTAFTKVYPTPFHPESQSVMTFQVDLQKAQTVTLEIFNILGQTIASKSVAMPPGKEQPIEWIPQTMTGAVPASGVYVFRIDVGTRTQTGKFTILN